MNLIVTQEDLIRYLYNETSVTETQLIEEAIQNDFQLRYQLEELRLTHAVLDLFAPKSPSNTSIQLILRHNNKGKAQQLEQFC